MSHIYLLMLTFFPPSLPPSLPPSFPNFAPVISPSQRTALESRLNRHMSQRPTKDELHQRNIIPMEQRMREQQFEDRKVVLERKLSRRPTVKELREMKILM